MTDIGGWHNKGSSRIQQFLWLIFCLQNSVPLDIQLICWGVGSLSSVIVLPLLCGTGICVYLMLSVWINGFYKAFCASFTCLSTFQPVSSHVGLVLQEFIVLDFPKKVGWGFSQNIFVLFP